MTDDRAVLRPGRWLLLLVILVALGVLLAARATTVRRSVRFVPSSPEKIRPAVVRPEAKATPHQRPVVVQRTPAEAANFPVVAARTPAPSEPSATLQPVDTTTTTTTPLVTPVMASSVPAAVTFHGWLSGPESVSASYPTSASSSTRAVATWNSPAILNLAVTCAGATRTLTGAPGISLPLSAGSCTVTISGPADVSSTSFIITVGGP